MLPSMCRAFILVVAAVLVTTTVRTARAQTIPEVEIKPGGPSQRFPVGEMFAVTGAIGSDVQQVQAVFVRYARYPFGAGGGRNGCRDVGADLSELVHDADGAPKIFGSLRGIKDADEVWADPKIYGDKPVYLPAPWKRPDDDAGKKLKSFRVVVDDAVIFQPGSHTCMFLYQRIDSTKKDRVKIPALVKSYLTSIGGCAKSGSGAKACTDQALQALGQGLKDLLSSIDDEAERDRIDRVVRVSLYNLAKRNAEARTAVQGALAAWPTGTPPSGFGPLAFLDVSANKLAEATAQLLAHHGKALLMVSKKSTLTFHSLDGKVPIRNLRTLTDGASLEAAADPAKPGKRVKLQVKLTDLELDGLSVDLADVIAFSQGRLPGKGGWITVNEWQTSIRELEPDAATTHLTTLVSWLKGIQAFYARANEAAAFAGHQALFDWLGANPTPATVVSKSAALIKALEQLIEQQEKWKAAMKNATLTVKRVTAKQLLPEPTRAAVQLDQKAFFTNFVTPFAGRATLLPGGDPVGTFYVGVQVFLFPNPVDSPMWTNGAQDAPRLFAVELGMATEKDDIGGNPLITGIDGDVPPIFIGAALHPLPYSTLSVGLAIHGVRQTGLPQEDITLRGTGYVGLSVQANVPDIIRSLVDGGGAESGGSEQ